MIRISQLFTACCAVVLAGTAGAADPQHAAPIDLAEAFRTCVDMSQNRLADELMRSVWDPAVRLTLPSRVLGQARGYSFVVDAKMDEATARIDLLSPPRVANVAPLALSATTTPEGSGLAVFVLEFGQVSSQVKAHLKGWAARAPATMWDSGPPAIKVKFFERPDKTATLVCDVST